ncbi:MAG: CoA transferase subunit A [Nitrososphaerota archaeon]|nr:CoA transferase subunit A [Nitrososphaerota archaeon]
MNKVTSLSKAVKQFVKRGSTISFGGFVGRQPQAAVHEIVRQNITDLHVIGDTNCVVDALIGMGCVNTYEFGWQAISMMDSGYNMRRSVEQGIPTRIIAKDYSNQGIALRLMAGAFNIPFMPTKSMLGSDILKYNQDIKVINDPFTGKPITLVPACKPDVSIISVQRSDSEGNCQIFGPIGADDVRATASDHTIVLCEELVSTDYIRKYPNMTTIPSYSVDAVVRLPYNCHPNPCYGCYYGDPTFLREYGNKSRTREGFLEWIQEWVLTLASHEEYCSKVGWDWLKKLGEMEQELNRIPFGVVV